MGVQEKTNLIRVLQNKIIDAIKIPVSLKNNSRLKISKRWGLYLSFYSNSAEIGNPELSDVTFRLFFVTIDDQGNFIGDNVRIGIIGSGDVTDITDIDVVLNYTDMVTKVNNWLEQNEPYLKSSITN
jgi:hypothetical protein